MEDLYVPGYFEIQAKKGDEIVISAGIEEIKPESLKKLFNEEVGLRLPIDSFYHALVNAAHQFHMRVSGQMAPPVDHQAALACAGSLMGKYRAEKSRAYNEIIKFLHQIRHPLSAVSASIAAPDKRSAARSELRGSRTANP